MSLKAKIEAVIYASEEPVTLAQLVGLLGEEAQAELDALASQQQQLALEEGINDPDALNAEVIVVTEIDIEEVDEDAEVVAVDQADGSTEEPEVTEIEPGAEAPSEPVSEEQAALEAASESAANSAPAEAPAIDAEAAAKSAAAATRARERSLREYFRSLVEQLISDYASNDRGLEIREVAGGFRLATKPEYHDAVRGFVKSLKPPLKLSLQALETLAVVAYKQPVTAPEISEIRGVDSGGVLGSLMARKLITTAGRKQVIGRPILYKTTKDFLVRFGLKDINELPSIEEFEKMAGELADMEPSQEEIPMETEPHNTSEEGAEADGSPAFDELNSAPEPSTELHDNVEATIGDNGSEPEGHTHEDNVSEELEPDNGKRAEDGIEGNPADEIIVDGRLSGPPPAEEQDPSAEEAEIQSNETEDKT
ncbi:MAG: SMC-Scp complex subunit ScpB [Acidobacteriota bacterium]